MYVSTLNYIYISIMQLFTASKRQTASSNVDTGYMNVITYRSYTYEHIYIFFFADATHHMWSSTRTRIVCGFVSCLPQ